MADIERLHYFNNQFLKEEDFTDEQAYHLKMRREHNRLLHTPGIAEGLEVQKTGPKEVTVTRGSAIDSNGREMILLDDLNMPLTTSPSGSTIYVTITYEDKKPDDSSRWQPPEEKDKADSKQFTRWIEKAKIEATTEEPDSTVIKLAQFKLDENGNVPGNINDKFDGGVIQIAAAKIPNFSISIQQLINKKVAEGTKEIEPGATFDVGTYAIEASQVSSALPGSNKSAFLLVYAYSETEGAIFNWRQQYKTEKKEEEGDTSFMMRQYVIFQNELTTKKILLNYTIYALLGG